MNLNFHIHHHFGPAVMGLLERIYMKAADATAALEAIATSLATAGDQLAEGLGEITAKLAELQDGGTTPAQDAIITDIADKVAAVATTSKALADIVPNKVI